MSVPNGGEELQRFLAAHPATEAVQLVITDPSGVVRGKSVRTHELARLYASGRPVAGSILGLDVTGEDVDATGLVWDTGDADQLCRPVPGTLLPAPWLARPSGQVMLSMYELDGRPAAADPRHALARAIARLEARGLQPVLACELEFYLLREDPQPQQPGRRRLVPVGRGASGGRDLIDAYSLARLEDLAPLFDEVYAAARAQGLPAETLMSEYAPGQFEITLTHRADALRAVDEAVLFQRLLRGVAARHGCIATFMAKPFAQRAGSGLHLHVSLADAAGRNVFAAADPAGSEACRHAIGGLKATMAESLLAFAPNANSYRRFRSRSYAPVAPIWGINNRSVSLRVPTGPEASRHIEHRIAGADANLYVAAAAVLAGVEQGLRLRLDPGPPVSGNGYALQRERELPATWQEAIERAGGSAFLAEALGPDFLRIYLAIKRQECERFSAEVTELDLDWYLQSV
ncbi:MAG: glutamine synthetase family protein [Steroidobacteraceae bacterium]